MVLNVKRVTTERVTTEFGVGDGEDVIILTCMDSLKIVSLGFRIYSLEFKKYI